MAENDALDVYLNDHLAASAAAVELVERLRDNNEGTPLAAYMDVLGREIEADRTTLMEVMERLDVAPSKPKQVVGKAIETLSRFRLSDRVTGDPDVTRLMETETLSLGIEGKLGLWRALSQVISTRPALTAFDLPRLMSRAIEQRTGLEPYRLEAAAQALGTPPAER